MTTTVSNHRVTDEAPVRMHSTTFRQAERLSGGGRRLALDRMTHGSIMKILIHSVILAAAMVACQSVALFDPPFWQPTDARDTLLTRAALSTCGRAKANSYQSQCLLAWAGGTACLAALAWLLGSYLLWLKYLFVLGALLGVPLARLGIAPFSLA
jgi:hypothetical protein